MCAWESALGQLCVSCGPSRNDFGNYATVRCVRSPAGYVKSLSGEGAYCGLGRGFFDPFGSTAGRSATPFARLRRL